MVICLEQGAAYGQLMLLPLTVSCFSKIWYQLTRVVLDNGPLNACVCVCVSLTNVLCMHRAYTLNVAVSISLQLLQYSYRQLTVGVLFFVVSWFRFVVWNYCCDMQSVYSLLGCLT